MSNPLETFDYAESLQQLLQIEQQARWAAEQDCQHWRERCQELLETLRPLAMVGEAIGSNYDDDRIIAHVGTLDGEPVRLRVGDARRAAEKVVSR